MLRVIRPDVARAPKHPYEIHLASAAQVVSSATWIDDVLGSASAPQPPAMAERQFRDAVANVDFLFPTFDSVPLVPELLALRNRARCRTRLLLVSHTSATLCLWWALLRPLLRPGDRIIAPTESARRTLEFICPDLAPYIRVVHIPMAVPPAPDRTGDHTERVLTSMTRIYRLKLLHRQIEALAILKARGRRVRLNILGKVTDDGGGSKPYARSLIALAERLGLAEQVSFPGFVREPAAKAAFWRRSTLAVNLSVTPEESFGKAPVEALGMGTPVIGTRFDGLVETIGSAGVLVPVREQHADLPMLTVTPEAVADAIESVLDDPVSVEACREQASRFSPSVVLPRLLHVCEEALEESRDGDGDGPSHTDVTMPAAPSTGLLAVTAPLTEMSWPELFERSRPEIAQWRIDGCRSVPTPFARLIFKCTAPWTVRFMAGIPTGDLPKPDPSNTFNRSHPPILRTLRPTRHATFASRRACLEEYIQKGPDRAKSLFGSFSHEERRDPRMMVLLAETEWARGNVDGARALAVESYDARSTCEEDASRMARLGLLMCLVGCPEEAVSRLNAWVMRYPDSFGSGRVWGQLGWAAVLADPPRRGLAERALRQCHILLGTEHPISRRLELGLERSARPLQARTQ